MQAFFWLQIMSAKEYTLSFLLAAGVQNSYKSVFGEADKCLEKFRDALKSIEKESVAIDKIINLERKLQSSAHISNDEIMKQSHDLELLKQKAGLSGASFADLTKKQQELALASKKARFGMLSKQGESLYSDASQKLMGMASMITATLAKPISDALAMDDARAELRKYSDDWKGIFSDIQGLTTKYASSFEDMTAMGVSNMQAGIAKNREEVSKLIELQSKAQVAFDLEKGQVGQIWADIQSRMKLDIDGTKKVFDLINQYGNVRNVKAVEVSEILQRQGGTLRGLTAFNEKQITALAAAFKEVSPSVEVAATSMGTFVSRLTSGAAATKQQREAMSKLGLNAITVAKQLTGTPEEAEAAVKDIFARINQLADSEKGAVIGQLFGNEAGIKAAVSTLSSNTEVLATNFRIAGNEAEYAGSMDKEFAARSDTASNAIQLAKNNLRLLSGVIGNAFLPQIKELTESFDATSIKEWADENKDLLEVLADMFTKVAEIVGAYFGLKLMVGASIKAYTGFIDIINEAKGAIDLIRNSTLFQTAATKLAQWWTVVWTGVTNGAAESGNIKRIARDLGKIPEALLIARFAPQKLLCSCGRSCCNGWKVNLAWEGAISAIAEDIKTSCFTDSAAEYRKRIVGRYFSRASDREPYALIAFNGGVSSRTVRRHYDKVCTFLKGTSSQKGVENIVLDKLDDILREKKIVGEM